MLPKRQQGMALLTVLLLVVVITVVAGSMLASQKIALRKQMLLLDQNQILQDIVAAEQIAAGLIAADMTLNNSDSMQDAWAQKPKPLQIGSHKVTLNIYDASRKFNINNLYHDGAVDEAALAAFQRLLSNVGLDPILAYAVLDWQDPDNETLAEGGAERDAYEAQDNKNSQSVVASITNQPFISVDELAAVKGFTPAKLATLKPYITAVPYYLPVNANTADAVVLASLVEGGSAAQFAPLVKAVQTQPFDSLDNLMQTEGFAGLDEKAKAAVRPLLAVDSQAFEVLIDVEVDAKHRYATTFISKVAKTDAANNGQADNQQPANSGIGGNIGEQAAQRVIRPYNRKLWTYRPNL
ncbi:type II secretion system minor pseudopilin GspK [Psychrobacter sp. I-STPA10]|uniref:type II secretion system minor pseudopilin GspK n=1 Tax=Psychrobacter sp. I-STPA10 TaxID=2585769 RepID=UPI001E313BDA|nr:type II secretion system minor pseudopilin GspK [Psychrobacter sp. I-STPA10]